VVLAAKYALKAKKDDEKRSRFKYKLIRLLLERNYTIPIINKIFNFVDTLINLPTDLQLEYNSKIDKLVQKTTTMELKFEYTNSYQVFQKVLAEKDHEKDLIVMEKDKALREKDHEKDIIVREKEQVEHEKLAIVIHSIEKLLEKNFPVNEIAYCLGLAVSEIEHLIDKYKIMR